MAMDMVSLVNFTNIGLLSHFICCEVVSMIRNSFMCNATSVDRYSMNLQKAVLAEALYSGQANLDPECLLHWEQNDACPPWRKKCDVMNVWPGPHQGMVLHQEFRDGLYSMHIGHSAVPVAWLTLESRSVCCWAHAYPPTLAAWQLCVWAHWTMTRIVEQRCWLVPTELWVIPSTWWLEFSYSEEDIKTDGIHYNRT